MSRKKFNISQVWLDIFAVRAENIRRRKLGLPLIPYVPKQTNASKKKS